MKVAAVFAVLLACYSALIWIHPIHATRFVDRWSQNQILAERLMFEANSWPRILVGSSMSLVLEQPELGDDLYNLSFARLGASTGLEVIRRLGLHPKEVIIETNLVQPVDHQLVDQLFDPLLLPARRLIPAFRSEYRPVNFIINWSSRRERAAALDSPIVVDNADPRLRARLIAENQRGSDYPLLGDQKTAVTEELPAYVHYLVGRGTRVTFLEMPMDPRVAAATSFRTRSAMIKQAFPSDRYQWIDVSPAGPFETRDGVRLLHAPAVRVARLLRSFSK